MSLECTTAAASRTPQRRGCKAAVEARRRGQPGGLEALLEMEDALELSTHELKPMSCDSSQGTVCRPAAASGCAIEDHPSSSSSPALVKTRLHAAGICCPMEARLVHSMLDSVPGVATVEVCVVTKAVTVRHDATRITPAALLAALNSAGLQASLTGRFVSQQLSGDTGAGIGTATQQRSVASRIVLAARCGGRGPPLLVVLSVALLVINLLLLPAAPVTPPGKPPHALRRGVLALVGALLGCPPVLRKAAVALRAGSVDMNCLVVVALAGAAALGEWLEAGALVSLFTLAEWLEDRCVSRAADALEEVLRLQPETALVVTEPDKGGQQQGRMQTTAAADQQQQQVQSKPEGSGCCAGGDCSSACSGTGSSKAGTGSSEAGTAGHPPTQASLCAGRCNDGSCCLPLGDETASVTGSGSDGGGGCGGGGVAGSGGCCGVSGSGSVGGSGGTAYACSAASNSGSRSCCSTATNTTKNVNTSCCNGSSSRSCQPGPGDAGAHGAGYLPASTPQLHDDDHDDDDDHHHHHHHHQQQQQQQQQLLLLPASMVAVGALVLVRPGERVPVDGVVESGSSLLDESLVTGEARPVQRAQGDRVLAGTLNAGGGALHVRCAAAAADSTVARLGALMSAAAGSRSRRETAVEAFARVYTPAIISVAAATAVLGCLLQPAAWRHWAYTALAVLVAGCPCALVISTPVASVAGIARAARRGVLLKGGRCLELLAALRAVSFDKSGTLTEGAFVLTQLHPRHGCSQDEALRLAAALEVCSSHPLAASVVGAAAARGCCCEGDSSSVVEDAQELPGQGVMAQLRGGRGTVAIGSWALARELLQSTAAALDTGTAAPASSIPDAVKAELRDVGALVAAAEARGSTVVCLVMSSSAHGISGDSGARVQAVLELADRPRPDATAALAELSNLGVRCVMLTGDSIGAASHIARQLDMPQEAVSAQLLPQDKMERLAALRRQLSEAHAAQGMWRSTWDTPWRCWQRHRAAADRLRQHTHCSTCAPRDCTCAVGLRPMGAPSSSGFADVELGVAAGHPDTKGGAITSAVGVACDTAAAATAAAGVPVVQRGGAVIAHVGDGINDAPALAAADIGVAMGVAGAALAVDAADVALFTNDLTSLPFAVRLGRRTVAVIHANTGLAVAAKAAVLLAAAAGAASLWLALLADVGASLAVTLHALTLLRFEAAAVGGGVESSSTRSCGNESCRRWRAAAATLPGLGWMRPYELVHADGASAATSIGVSSVPSGAASHQASRRASSCCPNDATACAPAGNTGGSQLLQEAQRQTPSTNVAGAELQREKLGTMASCFVIE